MHQNAKLRAESALTMPVILQVLPALGIGGVERGTVDITRAIADAGGTALVASEGGPLVAHVERAGGRHVAMKLGSKNPFRIWRNANRLAKLIRAESVDIVHARSRAPAWSAWLACRRTGARFVTTYHGVYGEDLPFKRRYNAVMARGERVIAGSRYVANLVVNRHGIDPSIIRVIYRGVDATLFDPDIVVPDRIARLAAAWRLPDGHHVVMLPGRLTSWKGQRVMIAALAKLGRPDVCCVLVGSDQGRHAYSQMLVRDAERLGVAAQLRLPGPCTDMPAALLLADVVVNASTAPEAFGRTVIEGQAMARLVLATDHGGAVETVEHGVTGWRVPPDDADALAEAVQYALTCPESERRAVGQAAREAVQLRFTVAQMQRETLAVYNELLR
jgi:glycosyltransferase involved in cell wall biosynthesis